MTIDELTSKVPDSLKPIATQYGPALLQWSSDKLWAWICLVQKGEYVSAYSQVVKSLNATQLNDEWAKLNADWSSANAENASSVALQKEATVAIVKAILSVVVTMI